MRKFLYSMAIIAEDQKAADAVLQVLQDAYIAKYGWDPQAPTLAFEDSGWHISTPDYAWDNDMVGEYVSA